MYQQDFFAVLLPGFQPSLGGWRYPTGRTALFSVIIPLHNKAHTIVDTLNSVMSQTFAEFEVVIVNDGSNDDGPQRIEQYFQDSRIRLINQKHQGVSVARNRGVEAARHELIAFLDADDILLPKYLETMNAAIEQFPDVGMYCCAGFTRYPDGSGYLRTSRRFRGKISRVKYFVSPNFYGNCSSIVVRKPHFLRCGGFPVDMTHSEDDVLFYKLALQTTVIFCPTPLTIYRKGIEGQASSDTDTDAYSNDLIIDKLNRVYAFFSSLDHRDTDQLFVDLAITLLRGILLGFIRDKDYGSIDRLFGRVDPGLRRYFTTVERSAGKGLQYRLAAVQWIYASKLKRRVRFFPPRGKYRKQLPNVPELRPGRRRTQLNDV